MSEIKPATSNETTANKRQGRLTIFVIFPVLIALAIAAFSASYAETRFGVLASIAVFVVVAVLAFLIAGYVSHILYALVSWILKSKR